MEQPIDSLLTRLFADLRDLALVWEAGVLVACALAAWLAMRLARPYVERAGARLKGGSASVRRVGFPLVMLLALLLAREVALLWAAQTPLLDLAVPLLLALAAVRVLVDALRYVFEASESLKLWERTATWVVWGAFALHVTGLLPRIHAAMEALAFQSGSRRFSLWLLFQAAAVVVIAMITALMAARIVERRLMGVTQMNLSLRMALAKASRTLLLILAVLVALPAVGIDLTVLSVFGGALGVGIGFGLQKVASNYISGFIILLDRSVRIGDLVTVDNKHGQVTQINTRYTLLRSMDGTESIIPNEMLITHTVVNHSLTRPSLRIELPVRVSYETDLERAEALMLEAARAQSGVVVDDPESAPRVYLKEFADNGVVLELAIGIRDPREGQNDLRSDLNWAIWRRFKVAGIEIPFPQRVVHLVAPGQTVTSA
jgi:small-conductance mechanosensitive channel